MLHIDWERVSLSSYLEAMEAHNMAAEPIGSREPVVSDPDRVSRFLKAHNTIN